MDENRGFIFYKSYYDALKQVSVKTRHELIDAIIMYFFEDEEPCLTGAALPIFTIIKPMLSANKIKSDVAKRGAPVGNKNASKKNNSENNSETNHEQTENNSENNEKQFLLKRREEKNNKREEKINIPPISPTGDDNKSSLIEKTCEVIDRYADDADIKSALYDFAEMRSLNNKPLTPRSTELLLSKLDRIAKSKQDKLDIINNSIMSGYYGFYIPNNKSDSKNKKTSFTNIDNHDYTEEDYNSMFDNFGGTT